MSSDNTGAKQARGRFRKGESGNPAGKPPGTRHATTLAVETLLAGDAERLTRKAIELAINGDTTALRLCLERIAPVRKEAPIIVEGLPPITSPQDAPRIVAALVEKVAAGQLAPGEAQSIATLLESYRRQSELADIEARLSRLEEIDVKTR